MGRGPAVGVWRGAMFNSLLFQIALCVLLVFLIMSAMVSVVQDIIIQGFRLRAYNLRRSIVSLLTDDTYQLEIADRFYRHPMTMAMSGGHAHTEQMEPMTFVTALSTAVQPAWSTGDPIDTLPASVAALKDGDLKKRLQLILPPPGSPREAIIASVSAWFSTAEAKMTERFKFDAIVLSYATATALTLLFNVSTLHVAQSFKSNAQLTQTIASITPGLATSIDQNTTSLTGAITATAPPQAQVAAQGLKDSVRLASVLACVKGDSDLPIGWPWMAQLVELARARVDAATHQTACQRAVEAADGDPALQASLELVGSRAQVIAAGSPAAHHYGPDFTTDGVWQILIGWMITIVAAAQGAPFWFNAIRKVAGK